MATMSSSSDGWPPVAQARPSAMPGSPSVAPGPMSTVPVVHDISDLGLEGATFKSGKRKKAIVAVLGIAAVVGGAGFAITRLDQPPTAHIEVPKAQAAQAPAPAYTPPAPVATPAPTPEAAPTPAPTEEPKKEEASASGRLSDDVKAALLSQDKEKSSKKSKAKSSKAARRSSGSVARRSSGPSTGFKSGGNANDPLNGKL
jgi:hypothetical protein